MVNLSWLQGFVQLQFSSYSLVFFSNNVPFNLWIFFLLWFYHTFSDTSPSLALCVCVHRGVACRYVCVWVCTWGWVDMCIEVCMCVCACSHMCIRMCRYVRMYSETRRKYWVSFLYWSPVYFLISRKGSLTLEDQHLVSLLARHLLESLFLPYNTDIHNNACFLCMASGRFQLKYSCLHSKGSYQ